MTTREQITLALAFATLARRLVLALSEGIDDEDLDPEELAELRAQRHAELERTRALTPIPDGGAVAGE